MVDVPDDVWLDLANDARPFRTECPGCRQTSRFPQKYLGHKVQCKRCQASLDADWGEVVTEG
jgi:hypothetical protein